MRGLLPRSVEISLQALCKRSLRSPLQYLCNRPLGKTSAIDLYTRSLQEVSVGDPVARDVDKRSQISWDRSKRSLYKIAQCLYERSLGKIAEGEGL